MKKTILIILCLFALSLSAGVDAEAGGGRNAEGFFGDYEIIRVECGIPADRYKNTAEMYSKLREKYVNEADDLFKEWIKKYPSLKSIRKDVVPWDFSDPNSDGYCFQITITYVLREK